jgi:hypothetical protein
MYLVCARFSAGFQPVPWPAAEQYYGTCDIVQVLYASYAASSLPVELATWCPHGRGTWSLNERALPGGGSAHLSPSPGLPGPGTVTGIVTVTQSLSDSQTTHRISESGLDGRTATVTVGLGVSRASGALL